MRSSWTTVLTKLATNRSHCRSRSSLRRKSRRPSFERLERRDVLSGVPLTSFGFDFRFRQPIAGNDFNLEAKTEMAYAATEVRFYWESREGVRTAL